MLPRGGPIWLDFDHEFEDALEVPQIVGHTRCARRTPKGRSYCIDFAQAAYAVVEAGGGPASHLAGVLLGEAVLDDAGA